jgi:hypothetical protein
MPYYKTLQGGPSHSDTLILGAASEILRFGSTGAVTPAGTDHTNGGTLIYTVNVVTGADNTKGVVLPVPAAAGQIAIVYSATATNGLKVYPGLAGTINGGSANAAVTIEGKTAAICVSTDTANWAVVFTANT